MTRRGFSHRLHTVLMLSLTTTVWFYSQKLKGY